MTHVQFLRVDGLLIFGRAIRDGKKWLLLVTKMSDVLRMRT